MTSTPSRSSSTDDGAGRLHSALVSAFAATIIEIEHPDGTWLIRPVGEADTPSEGAGPSALPDASGRLHVLTACNPGSVPLSVDRNARRQDRLAQQLRSLATACWPAVGRSEDGSWAEPSFAVVGLDRTVAAAIGQQSGQLAIFEITDDILVVRCRDTEVVSRTPAVLHVLPGD